MSESPTQQERPPDERLTEAPNPDLLRELMRHWNRIESSLAERPLARQIVGGIAIAFVLGVVSLLISVLVANAEAAIRLGFPSAMLLLSLSLLVYEHRSRRNRYDELVASIALFQALIMAYHSWNIRDEIGRLNLAKSEARIGQLIEHVAGKGNVQIPEELTIAATAPSTTDYTIANTDLLLSFAALLCFFAGGGLLFFRRYLEMRSRLAEIGDVGAETVRHLVSLSESTAAMSTVQVRTTQSLNSTIEAMSDRISAVQERLDTRP